MTARGEGFCPSDFGRVRSRHKTVVINDDRQPYNVLDIGVSGFLITHSFIQTT